MKHLQLYNYIILKCFQGCKTWPETKWKTGTNRRTGEAAVSLHKRGKEKDTKTKHGKLDRQ